jgi:hypothetical protein
VNIVSSKNQYVPSKTPKKPQLISSNNKDVKFINFVTELGKRNKDIKFASMQFVPIAERIIKSMVLKDPENEPNLFDVLNSNKYQQVRGEITFGEFRQFCLDYELFAMEDASIDSMDDINFEIDSFLNHVAKRKANGFFYLDEVINGIRSLKQKSKEQMF